MFLFICSVCLFFLILGYSLAGATRRSYVSENFGEFQVQQQLTEYCQNRQAHVLNNITLRLEDGSTTQIDHILISTQGIFVIETKHYSGWIFADAKSKVWTQCIYRIKNKFQNPLLQNYKHVKAVETLFSFLSCKSIHNLVVFSGKAEFKSVKPANVFYIDELIPAIQEYPENVLNLNYIQFCIGRLEYMRLALTQETDVEHQAYLEKKFKPDY